MPKVSILVPIYNMSKLLRKCLDSCINQTLKDIEIICLNDGSTDNSLDIIKEYAQNDNRIVIVDKPNSGYGNSMNIGLKKATGEYIGIVEADDWARLDMFEVLYNKAKENNLDFIKADYTRFIGEGKTYEEFYTAIDISNKYYNKVLNPQENLDLFEIIMSNWAGIYKRRFIINNNIKHNETSGASFQDTGFWFQVFSLASRVMFLNKPLYMYKADNTTSSRRNKEKVFCIFEEYKYIEDFINKKGLRKKLIKIFNYRKFRTYMNDYIRIAPEFRKIFLEKMRKELILAFANNEIKLSMFSKKELRDLNLMINHKILFYIQRELMFALWTAIKLEIYGRYNVRMTLFGIKIKVR
jgi:glycosyltransferase involved in cell wall biosynthesis